MKLKKFCERLAALLNFSSDEHDSSVVRAVTIVTGAFGVSTV